MFRVELRHQPCLAESESACPSVGERAGLAERLAQLLHYFLFPSVKREINYSGGTNRTSY
jgi:hypothetical protein